jgi:SAM-dependent methyltransferase
MESLPEIQAGITVPSRDQQERSSWRAIPTPEWIRKIYSPDVSITQDYSTAQAVRMEATPPKNAQTSSKTEYAGSDELWAGERALIKYNRDLISKLVKGQEQSKDVLEFGAGIGTLAHLWELSTGTKPECLEIDPNQRAIVKGRGFRCHEELEKNNKMFDTIYTSNVLEHIKNDRKILKQLYSKIKPGGSLIIYVPAFQLLYSELDEKVGHYRRYEKKDLLEKLNESGFAVAKFRYSDSIGFFAWLYIKVKGYSATKSEDKSMKIYDKYVFPLSKICDNLGCKYLFGKNILVVAQKPIP